MYTNVADITCMNYPGSENHFKTDVETFSEWGVDYIKLDGCFVGEDRLNTGIVATIHYLIFYSIHRKFFFVKYLFKIETHIF